MPLLDTAPTPIGTARNYRPGCKPAAVQTPDGWVPQCAGDACITAEHFFHGLPACDDPDEALAIADAFLDDVTNGPLPAAGTLEHGWANPA